MEPISKNKKAGLFLFMAIASLYLGRAYQIPVFLLFFPFFAMCYLRMAPVKTGLLLLLPGSLMVIIYTFQGISAHMFSGWGVFFVVMTISTILGLLPLLADRTLFKKINPLLLVFIYPCSKVILEYLTSSNSPFGIWGSQASLLAGWFPLTGIVSVTGIWGLSFLVSLLPGLGLYLIENGLKANKSKLLITAYVITVVFCCIYGFVRNRMVNERDTVRVAAVLANDSLRKVPVMRMYQHLTNQKGTAFTNDSTTYFQNAFLQSNSDLLIQTRGAADKGAKIIFWAEGNGLVLKKDEPGLLDSVKTIARKYNIYIGMAVEVFSPVNTKPVENKIVLVKPDGGIGFEYYKRYPLGIEKELMVKGDGNIVTCLTPYGKIAAVICFDTDFISYARKVGQANADILFAPSNDWEAIAALRGKITKFRALENGCTLVRPTSHGVTEMIDPAGRTIKQNNFFQNSQQIVIADVPAKRLYSFYAMTGDFFPVMVSILLLFIIMLFYKKSRFSKGSKQILRLGSLLLFPILANANSTLTDSLPATKSFKIRKSKTILFPAISYAPETNLSLGASIMHFYRSTADAKLSQINANMLYTLNNQFINEITSSHYLKQNRYLMKADIKLNKFPEKYFGIGNKTTEANTELISYHLLKTNFSLLKKVWTHTYVGLKYSYAGYYHIQSDRLLHSALDSLARSSGNCSSGIGFSLVYDSRDNEMNCTKGVYTEINSIWNHKKIGSDEDYYMLDADIRKYRQLRSGAVLACQAVLNVKEGNIPFTQLSYLGGNMIMRGFYAGRYRDNDLLAFQTEYRRKLLGKWGFTLFAGAGKVGHTVEELGFHDLQHSLGFGFRRSLSKSNKVNLRIDIGYGNGNSNIYINIGEAF